MSRILFLTQVLPYPLDAGPKVRAYYMLRHLAATHEVTLVSFVRPDDKPEYIEHLRQKSHDFGVCGRIDRGCGDLQLQGVGLDSGHRIDRRPRDDFQCQNNSDGRFP
jgi:hypothetical protein